MMIKFTINVTSTSSYTKFNLFSSILVLCTHSSTCVLTSQYFICSSYYVFVCLFFVGRHINLDVF